MSAHYVYRVYDSDGRLIYVGCTANLFARLRAHGHGSWWAMQASRVVAKVYPDKDVARAAERAAIQAERPRWNLGARGPVRTWGSHEYVDFVTSALRQRPVATSYTIDRLRRLVVHYQARFDQPFPIAIPDTEFAA